MTINMRVEFDPTPVRHVAVQCPYCQKWFYGHDITDDEIQFEYQLDMAKYHCPICDKDFGYRAERSSIYGNYARPSLNIQEVSYPEVYQDCLEKKKTVTWE